MYMDFQQEQQGEMEHSAHVNDTTDDKLMHISVQALGGP
jgi:hypothetical protein